MYKISHDNLKKFTLDILTKAGLDTFSAQCVSMGLSETSLRGVDSHGIRLLPHYVRSAESGRKNKTPKFKISKKFPTIALLDADNGFGHAAGIKAIDEAIIMAQEYGMGCVGVINSSHPGAMATYALHAAQKGYIAFAFTHADSLLVSYNGNRPYFGTNPVCMAAPRKNMEPFCLDMATTIIPWNKILLHRAMASKLPDGVATDRNGTPTDDPNEAAFLLPFGGYKGYGLAAMVEIMCAIFTGTNFGRHIPSMYKTPMSEQRKLGQFYMVIKADGCIDIESFVTSLDQMTEEVRNEPNLCEESVMLAGDKEINCAHIRQNEGIPVDHTTASELKILSESYNVPLNFL